MRRREVVVRDEEGERPKDSNMSAGLPELSGTNYYYLYIPRLKGR